MPVKCTPDPDRYNQRILGDLTDHQHIIIACGFANGAMHIHIEMPGAWRVNFVSRKSALAIRVHLPDVILHIWHEQTAGVRRQARAALADELIQRQPCTLRSDIPQCDIERPWQINGKEREMPIDRPQFMPDRFPLTYAAPEDDGRDGLMQIRLRDRA